MFNFITMGLEGRVEENQIRLTQTMASSPDRSTRACVDAQRQTGDHLVGSKLLRQEWKRGLRNVEAVEFIQFDKDPNSHVKPGDVDIAYFA
jgi:hypothetical protein